MHQILFVKKLTFIRRPVREPQILTFTGSLKTSVTMHKCHKVAEYPYICPKARVSQNINVLKIDENRCKQTETTILVIGATGNREYTV